MAYHAQSMATPIMRNIEYSSHENGFSSWASYIDSSKVAESSVRGSYSSASTFFRENKALMRSIFGQLRLGWPVANGCFPVTARRRFRWYLSSDIL